ncbi:hypothetical protein JVT61DRAFT_6739 [Boletus reticuloceps]|uniref:Uncharacterized protein n=1 Tax=Boletus reticuloceps TaxID=495285 RepID=A0A8I2YKD4_9AGAM|nr:hypothetical protein JVT61DRAFT_6739 [Boletus reticuloceps]
MLLQGLITAHVIHQQTVAPVVFPPTQHCAVTSTIPTHNSSYYLIVLPPPTTTVQHSRLSKFSMGPKEHELLEALEDWREQKMITVYGKSHLINIGPAIILPDEALDCIVDCAHFLKITTIDDLVSETHWSKANIFGMEVLEVIHRIIPVPIVPAVFTHAPLQPCSVPDPGTSQLPNVSGPSITFLVEPCSSAYNIPHVVEQPAVLKKNRCSACSQEGHNGVYPCYTSVSTLIVI